MPPLSPSGIRVDPSKGWVDAFYNGERIAGLTMDQAKSLGDGGKTWLYQAVAYHWGKEVLTDVVRGGIALVGEHLTGGAHADTG